VIGQAPVELLEGARLESAAKIYGPHEQRKFADMSSPARSQFLVHVAEAYETFEHCVLEEFDRLVFHKKIGRVWTSSCSDPLIIGLCIRRMSLQYRSYMINYKTYGMSKFFLPILVFTLNTINN
jgi:hypothetical protein